MGVTRRGAATWLAGPVVVAAIVGCSASGSATNDKVDAWREVSRAGVTFEVPADWSDTTLPELCRQNDPCSSQPAALTARVFFLEPLPGQRGGTGIDVAPNETADGWAAVAALDGVDMYVRGDSQAEVQRVLDSART